MVTTIVHNLTIETIAEKTDLKDQMETGKITDEEYSRELMKLLNRYRERLQQILDRNYHYLFTQD